MAFEAYQASTTIRFKAEDGGGPLTVEVVRRVDGVVDLTESLSIPREALPALLRALDGVQRRPATTPHPARPEGTGGPESGAGGADPAGRPAGRGGWRLLSLGAGVEVAPDEEVYVRKIGAGGEPPTPGVVADLEARIDQLQRVLLPFASLPLPTDPRLNSVEWWARPYSVSKGFNATECPFSKAQVRDAAIALGMMEPV